MSLTAFRLRLDSELFLRCFNAPDCVWSDDSALLCSFLCITLDSERVRFYCEVSLQSWDL